MQQTQQTPLIAVVHVLNHIRSKWFVIENDRAVEVTDDIFQDVMAHNDKEETTLKIPFSYKGGFITYPFGCGLTHYLSSANVARVTNSDVTDIRVIMTTDFTMYGFKKNESDWEMVLNEIIKRQGVR